MLKNLFHCGLRVHGNASNRAIVFVPLTSFDKRKGDAHSAAALLQRMREPLAGIEGALAVPFNRPRCKAWKFGGFTFEVEDLGATRCSKLRTRLMA